MTTPSHKIVIVSGQEFSVPAATDNEALRAHLAADFPDIASAKIKEGTRAVDGVSYPTVEFIKQAGTKGLGPVALAQLLRRVPQASRDDAPLATAGRARLAALHAGRLTAAQAMQDDALLTQTIEAIIDAGQARSYTERTNALCTRIAQLPAVAAPTLPHGW
jgi:hypothetical protein